MSDANRPGGKSESEVLWPGDWRARLRKAKRHSAEALVLAVLLLLFGLITFASGWVLGPPLLAVALAAVGMAAIMVADGRAGGRGVPNSITLQDSGVGRSTLLPHALESRMTRWIAFPVIAVAFGVLPWVMARVPWEGNAWNWVGHLVSFTAAPLYAVYLLPFVFSSFIRAFKPMGVALTPEGIVHTFWFCTCSYAWDGISTIAPGSGDGILVTYMNVDRQISIELNANVRKPIPGQKENWIGRTQYAREKMRSIPVARLAINPAIAYRAVEFYHKHPEHRGELGTDAGARRIRDADFPALATDTEA